MIIPSIDIRGGNAVQLERGRELRIDAGNPVPLALGFGRTGDVAVIDLDAALGSGGNEETIRRLLPLAPCRVGGGIRTLERARAWLDAGAERIIVGTRAEPEFLAALPRERLIVALDCDAGEVVVEGWRTRTGRGVLERMAELRGLCAGFLVTFVEVEGTRRGLALERVKELVEAAGPARLTVAGGTASVAEIAAADALGADVQVGMALYSGAFSVADALVAVLARGATLPDDKAVWPTVVVEESGEALGLAWSSPRSLRAALREGAGIYESRSRGLWRKGESSGNTQMLVSVRADCDRDALRFTVRQRGPFCHENTRTCWGETWSLRAFERHLRERSAAADSYTGRLLADPTLLTDKFLEEVGELTAARSRAEVVHEGADVLYFLTTLLQAKGVGLADIEQELHRRSLRLTRRGGGRKEVAP